MLFAFVPTMFGMSARVTNPGITDQNLVLPTVLLEQLPAVLGALALAAVFSTEVDTCDAVLFMVSTTMSKDIYQRHFKPDASDAHLLLVARIVAVVAGASGVALSIYLGTVSGALIIFYSLLGVTFFVPVLGGLYVGRAGPAAALAAIATGIATLFVVAFVVSPRPAWLDPTLSGIVTASLAYAVVTLVGPSRHPSPYA
jgi:SSS family solute:Na+ symporter